eukprot:g6262.t1
MEKLGNVQNANSVGTGVRSLKTSATKSRDLGFYLLSVVMGMIGLTYASVPLYRMFCNATGFAGTVRTVKNVEDKLKDRKLNRHEDVERLAAEREITIWFEGNVVDGMEWSFEPTQRSIKVHPGQSALAFFKATNKSKKPITGISTYNVTPNQTGYYFNKIQCFCFENQKLRPGECVDMPVFFYIDPEFATDRKMVGINDVTLSYTFFKVTDADSDVQDS